MDKYIFDESNEKSSLHKKTAVGISCPTAVSLKSKNILTFSYVTHIITHR